MKPLETLRALKHCRYMLEKLQNLSGEDSLIEAVEQLRCAEEAVSDLHKRFNIKRPSKRQKGGIENGVRVLEV